MQSPIRKYNQKDNENRENLPERCCPLKKVFGSELCLTLTITFVAVYHNKVMKKSARR